MSAREQMAMILNELMGPSRNDDVDRSALNYRDAEVCKFFLAGFCPHELFVNTKANIGPCQYYHDENLRIAYQKSRDFEKLGYERSFYRFLCRMHDDMMRKIQKNKERLALTQGQNDKKVRILSESEANELAQKTALIEEEIAQCLGEAERAGACGELELSQTYVKRVEELRSDLEKLISSSKTYDPIMPRINDPNASKPMEVCETCGCFLIIGDVQQRIDEHYTGKQHVGFAKITSTIKELRERFRKVDEEEDRHRRVSRSRSRERNHEHSSSHSKSAGSRRRDEDRPRSSKRSRSRSRDRDRHARHRHDRDRRRSRSRSRHRR